MGFLFFILSMIVLIYCKRRHIEETRVKYDYEGGEIKCQFLIQLMKRKNKRLKCG